MKKVVFLIFLVLSFGFFPPQIKAEENNSSINLKKSLERKEKELEEQLVLIRRRKSTLSSEIAYMNTQILLTNLKIKNTERDIKKAQEEIQLLNTRIDSLDQSLNYLSQLLISRIVENYKERNSTIFDLLFSSSNPAYFVNKIKYIKTARDNNQRLLIGVQKNKTNFEEQKQLREEKKKRLDYLQKQLGKQKKSLNRQKKAKQRLLQVTKNNESVYERLLSNARRELASLKSFVKSAGGQVITANSFGSGADGWYYSQRDQRWAYDKIGNSNENVLEVGCLITDIAMVLKKNGVNWQPNDISSNPDYFFSNTAYMLHPSRFSFPNGLRYKNIGISQIKEKLVNQQPVIVGLYAGKYGTHYVVLKKMDGDDYIMNDPYYGPDKKFSDYYSKKSIFKAAIIE